MPRPLQQSYWATATLVVFVLVPHIVVTTAYYLIEPGIAHDLHAGATGLAITEGLANAGYAFGALFGGDIVQRLPQRPLYIACTTALLGGFSISAVAPGFVVFASGRVLQGLATGFLLVVSVPPLVQRFGPPRMRWTTALINLAFFGAVAAGPLIAAPVAANDAWRWLFGGFALLLFAVITLSLVALPSMPPPEPGLHFDATAIALGLGGTVLAFLAVSWLTSLAWESVLFTTLLAFGVACIVALLLTEYHRNEPLSPVKPLSSTIPAAGTIAATIGGGAFVTLVLLVQRYLGTIEGKSQLHVGIDFWPQVLAVIVAAAALGALVTTRFLPHLTFAGMLCLVAGGLIMTTFGAHTSGTLVLAVTAVLGFGAGASVSPGLWIAGMSLPVQLVGRTFALVELIRSEGDFVEAPIIRKVANTYAHPDLLHGFHVATWATVAVLFAGTCLGLFYWLSAGAKAQAPDLAGWLEEGENAFHSPPPFARLRNLSSE